MLKDLAEAERKEGDLAQQFVAASHRAAQTVLIEAMVENHDVGFVRAGQEAEI